METESGTLNDRQMVSKTKISNKNQNAIFLMFRLLINIRNPHFCFTSIIFAVENVKVPSGRHSGKAYVSSALFFKELPDSSETGIRESKIGTECSINGRD